MNSPEQTVNRLAAEYALNVIEKGVACCHHTCNNLLFNQLVLNIISLPGIMNSQADTSVLTSSGIQWAAAFVCRAGAGIVCLGNPPRAAVKRKGI
ncbi:hypothetical protein [Desulfosarcina ovata]|uniref:Uncharacterized protein n=1 Tax=Desulfosarcina ovata subsp. ovata TaxID=2752305 RepID=A0A5K8AKY7_9BACT|nr:hypothetical protein [Desulfosarcina ovata]BBO92460.1 hypothetical protein DSCOOX_56400 [Desulfosarcina ovata subsp. ovata]